jgi:hypothetical protein
MDGVAVVGVLVEVDTVVVIRRVAAGLYGGHHHLTVVLLCDVRFVRHEHAPSKPASHTRRSPHQPVAPAASARASLHRVLVKQHARTPPATSEADCAVRDRALLGERREGRTDWTRR